ncbi:uncharacterized protein LOC125062484 [Pieris napi]|uniref:uncharacterized protein LOC125062484 n=1 Tax=Pieris napi TaxID=78633 RepID=UPI001FBB7F3C|nr:uncharacterized protein LOC125062484 [Pieris napi]
MLRFYFVFNFILIFCVIYVKTRQASLHPVLVARSSLDWMPSRVNSLYSDVGAWSGKFRPVMDEIESDEALRFYQFLNYLDGGSFGTGPIDEFVDAMNRLATYMKQQNSRETQVRGMRELEAINGEKGNSIKTVLEISTVIMRKKRKFFCTGEVKEPIVNNKIICKDRILLPIAGTSCRDAIMYWHPDLTEEHYCVGALESKSPVHIMDIEGEMFCKGDDYSKREYLLACDFYEDQESPVADLLQYYPDPDPEISPKLFS